VQVEHIIVLQLTCPQLKCIVKYITTLLPLLLLASNLYMLFA
jgi:hypothetical protein